MSINGAVHHPDISSVEEGSLPRLDDENFGKLTEHIQGLLKKMEELPLPKVQEDVFELLNCLDFMHREALTRLIELIEAQAPHLKLDMANDFAIQALMMVYGFVPDDAVSKQAPVQNGTSVVISLDTIPITQPPPLTMPIWMPAGNIADLEPGSMKMLKIEARDVLVCRVGDELFAMQNACLDSILPLERGKLDGILLHCPWHGCVYDVRSGEIQNGSKRALETYPIVIGKDGKFRVGFNISKKAAAFLAQTAQTRPTPS